VNLLERWARGWRRRWAAVVLLAAGATGVLVGVTVGLWLPRGAVAAGVLAAAALGSWLWRRRGRVTALAVARHLNRTVPALEESADLLLVVDTALTPLERLQRDRVARTLGALVQPPPLPRQALYLGGAYALVALLAAAGLSYAGGSPRHPATNAAGRARAAEAPPGPPQIVGVEVRLRPPGYTGRPERRARDWDLSAEVGAQVTWRVRTDRTVRALVFVTSEGDTLRLQPRDRTTYEGSITAERSFLYQVAIQDSGPAVLSDYHRLTVVPDEPPTLTIVHPDPRTAIAPGSPLTVPLEVVASDDYGVAGAAIVATVTAGSGEAVKFREQVLDFTSIVRHPDDRLLVLRRVLDLGALQMQPGDELYFYVLAHDRRTPQANAGRSDTYFITLTDTARVVLADLIGLAVTGLPEYLRSQRQIIIDTERLIAERARLTAPVFHDRSNGIGFDQHALRDRYGELAGDETVTDGTEPTIEHEHDTPENATLLAPTVKDKLQAALAQMWDAELRLRTYDPSGALPYEYRALALLKEAQQATRAYVQRTGFEPTPLEPDRTRLTGTLTGIGSVALQRTDTAGPSLPAVRSALDAASRLFAGAPPRVDDVAILERGGREIARLAIAQPGEHLETLRALRGLIASLSARDSTICRECALRAARGLWQALPPALPAAAGSGSTSGLARTYFERLRGRENP
jgi:hypothetical protein